MQEQQRNAFFFWVAQSAAKVGSRDRQSTWETARSALACSIRSILPRSLKCRTGLRFRDCIPRRRTWNEARSHASSSIGVKSTRGLRAIVHTCRVVLNDKSALRVTVHFHVRARFIRSASLLEEKFTGVSADYRYNNNEYELPARIALLRNRGGNW